MRGEARSEDARDDAIDDDVLRLMFGACHPALALESQIAQPYA